MQDVRTIARQHLIDASGPSKKEIIGKLQRQVGKIDCFATASDGQCDQAGCPGR